MMTVRSAALVAMVLCTTPAFSQGVRQPVPPAPPATPQPPAGSNRTGSDASETFDRTVKVGANTELLVRNISGETAVTVGSAGQIEIHALKRASSRQQDAAARLANTDIGVTATSNRVEVRIEARNQRNGSGLASVDFDIRVPPDCSVDVNTVSGVLRISGVKGAVRAQAVSGELTLQSTSRIARAKTVSGAIRITGSGGDASAEIETVSGDITVDDTAAHVVDLRTVSGSARLTGASAERISFRSVSGRFMFTGSLSAGGRYDLESHSGSIRLALADQPGFEVDASTFSGSIAIDFSIRNEGPVQTSGRGPQRAPVHGTYGDGSAILQLRTFSGDMHVGRR